HRNWTLLARASNVFDREYETVAWYYQPGREFPLARRWRPVPSEAQPAPAGSATGWGEQSEPQPMGRVRARGRLFAAVRQPPVSAPVQCRTTWGGSACAAGTAPRRPRNADTSSR